MGGGFVSGVGEWAGVVLNPADKGAPLPWVAGEKLVVIQEASEMADA